MHSCVRAGAFFLRLLLPKVDCEKWNFGGAVRGQTQLPQREACGAGSSSRKILPQAGSRPGGRFWKNESGQNLLVLFFVSVFDSLWFLFVLFFVLLCVCLAVCACFCAFMFSSRLGKSSLVSDLLCLCPIQCRPAGRLSVLSVHPWDSDPSEPIWFLDILGMAENAMPLPPVS